MTAAPFGAPDPRADARHAFVADALGTDDFSETSASADAGFRSYWRITRAGPSVVVMDAPPALIDCVSFLRIGDLLREYGLNVPIVQARDLDAGFLLLSDLGTATFLDALRAGADAGALMQAAIGSLVQLQGIPVPDWLPAYDDALLARELDLFPEWYLGHQLGVTLAGSEADDWAEARARLITASLVQPRVLVHRDFMPRNLMPGPSAPGILDFQDAVGGAIAYDPVSLLKDAFLTWPPQRVQTWLHDYHASAVAAGLPVPAWPGFIHDAEWCGMQRHLKILGIFVRLRVRDGKPKYADDLPRFVAYLLDVLPRYPELAGLERLLRRHAPVSAA